MAVFRMTNPTAGLPPLTWLRAFEAAARHLSFTRAAAELNLTQSAVSQHVRSLEAFLGRDLFVRKPRALALTEDGANYLPTIREAFNLLTDGTRAFTGGNRGRNLTVQCNMAFSVLWLAPRLKRLYARYPWLVLNIVTPIWDPERHAANAAVEIRFGRPEDMTGEAMRLTQDRFFPVCAAGYLESGHDLRNAPLFDCAGTTGTWSAWFNSRGKEMVRDSDVNLASTYVIAITAARNGCGFAMGHDTLVGDFLADGTLIRPFEHSAPLTEGYFLMPPSSHNQTPASEAFLGWIRDEMNTFLAVGRPV
ncbi:LysR family transcriptional regulator [Primorskyibacter sp. S87]|uniref:LysR family transcriptional regulator n=1 Tax=Primorskyibacter sp. S87 TaxID=3415126 RepID=UPI003C7DE97D